MSEVVTSNYAEGTALLSVSEVEKLTLYAHDHLVSLLVRVR